MEPTKYHAPKERDAVIQWLQGELPDVNNMLDTVDTVKRIRENNAAWRAICEPSSVRNSND